MGPISQADCRIKNDKSNFAKLLPSNFCQVCAHKWFLLEMVATEIFPMSYSVLAFNQLELSNSCAFLWPILRKSVDIWFLCEVVREANN